MTGARRPNPLFGGSSIIEVIDNADMDIRGGQYGSARKRLRKAATKLAKEEAKIGGGTEELRRFWNRINEMMPAKHQLPPISPVRPKERARNEAMVELRQPGALVAALRELGLSKRTATAIATAYPDGRGLEGAQPRALEALGATPAQARRVRAAFSVVRVCDEACEARVRGTALRSPDDVVSMFRQRIGRQEQEYFAVALLDSRARVMDILGVAVGSLAQVDVHPRDVFREAIRRNAHAIIVAHNHPSGVAEPSAADLQLTHKLYAVGKEVGIPLLDSLVITRRGDMSVAALGLLEPPGQPVAAEGNPDDAFRLTGRGLEVPRQTNAQSKRNTRRARRLSEGGR